MRKDDYVSLWLGNLESQKSLEKYLDIKYTIDGDMIPSKLATIFSIDRYDDDFREAKYFDKTLNNISNILENFSYDYVLIKYFKSLVGENLTKSYNTIILLYNFDYDGDVYEYSNGNETISFIGKTKYRNLYI